MTAEKPCHAAAVSAPYFTRFVEGRRGEILDAALCVFAVKGYEAGTMREIAAIVGVSEPALYRHYAGKEALLVDLVTTAGGQVSSEAGARLAAVQPSNLRESLKQLLHARRTGADNKFIMRTLMDAAPHNEAMRGVFREQFALPMIENVHAFIPCVDEFFGIKRAPEALNGAVRAFMSTFVGYFMTSMFFDDEPEHDAAIVNALLAIMGWNASAE
jgi:AcrR family transcriptional regulator